jgi:protein involved in polysaccharide export with SLBB domain
MKHLLLPLLALILLILTASLNAQEYRLVPGDELEIKIINHTNLNTKQSIAPDGTISMPLLGRIAAKDKELASFQSEIENKYRIYINNPQIVMYVSTKQTNWHAIASTALLIITLIARAS